MCAFNDLISLRQNASFNRTTTDGSESSRVDIVRKVADDIIKEKDGIIDKLVRSYNNC